MGGGGAKALSADLGALMVLQYFAAIDDDGAIIIICHAMLHVYIFSLPYFISAIRRSEPFSQHGIFHAGADEQCPSLPLPTGEPVTQSVVAYMMPTAPLPHADTPSLY